MNDYRTNLDTVQLFHYSLVPSKFGVRKLRPRIRLISVCHSDAVKTLILTDDAANLS